MNRHLIDKSLEDSERKEKEKSKCKIYKLLTSIEKELCKKRKVVRSIGRLNSDELNSVEKTLKMDCPWLTFSVDRNFQKITVVYDKSKNDTHRNTHIKDTHKDTHRDSHIKDTHKESSIAKSSLLLHKENHLNSLLSYKNDDHFMIEKQSYKNDDHFMIEKQEDDCLLDWKKNDLDNHVCVVCLDFPRSHLIKTCGHFVLCEKCSKMKSCPICRMPYKEKEDLIRVYT